jgi:hypothetical protein
MTYAVLRSRIHAQMIGRMAARAGRYRGPRRRDHGGAASSEPDGADRVVYLRADVLW